MNLYLHPGSCKPDGCHEFAVCIISRFPVARPLTLTLSGFLQFLFLNFNKLSMLLSNIEYIHDEYVEESVMEPCMCWSEMIVEVALQSLKPRRLMFAKSGNNHGENSIILHAICKSPSYW